jgi:very-short-patch-repair endonuclease
MSLVDAGAESPRETRLRLLLIRAGFPAPQTQIPVRSADGYRRYFVDMGWEDLMLAVEYDGDHHRVDRAQFAYDIERSEDIDQLGWLVVRVAARSRSADILRRVQRAWDARTR